MLKDERVSLRKVERSDIGFLFALFNDVALARFDTSMHPGTARYTLEKEFDSTFHRPHWERLVVTAVEDDRQVGLLSMRKDSGVPNNYSLSVALLEPELGKGYGTCAVGLAIEFWFDNHAAERVGLAVRDYNLRAIRSFEKCGFVKEGVLRSAAYYEGKYCDLVQMSIIRSEFASIRGSANS